MKLLFDFLPLILFFGVFKLAEAHKQAAALFATSHFGLLVSGGQVGPEEAPVLLGTLAMIVITLVQALVMKLRGKKIDLMLWISLALVVVLGGLTVWLHDETFIKWKPSGVYWGMALIFLLSDLLFGRNLLRSTLGEEIELPDFVWRRMNYAWALFFGAMGVLNLYVAYHFSTSAWASFKVFGGTGLMLLFILGLGLYMSRHLAEPREASAGDAPESKP